MNKVHESDKHVAVSVVDHSGVLTIRLQNLLKRNCLSIAMMQTIEGAITQASDNREIKLVVIEHAGSVFSSGMDLREIIEHANTSDPTSHPIGCLASLLTSIASLKKPLVLNIDGLVAAAGLSFFGVADVVLTTEQTSLLLPELRLGVVPGLVSVTFGRLVSRNTWWHLALSEEAVPIKNLPANGTWTTTSDASASSEILESLISSLRSVDYDALTATKGLLERNRPKVIVIDAAAVATSVEFFQRSSTLERIHKRLGAKAPKP